MRSGTSLIFASLCLAAGCHQAPPTSTATATVSSTTAARTYDAIAYDLHARFDWTQKQLTATENVTLLLDGKHTSVELDSQVQVSRVHAGPLNLPFTSDTVAKTLTVDLSSLHTKTLALFTIEYTAGTSSALLAAGPRDGDPVLSRVVFTDSEPDRGALWLVANHHPADRALWTVEVTVDAGEDVVANGERIEDNTINGQRTVRYALPAPIPTYLMAFAAGQMEHRDRWFGRIPLSVWYRKGLLIDPDKNLDAVADAMGTFQKLLGPYPWERYSVVLLPDYYGGMENATITFNAEPSGQGLVGFTLNAHELSHHWFGDWVTMHDFDDVWVKEGMATVLESEADRARRDRTNTGRLFGIDFAFAPTDAVVDDTLIGLDKYTSGPYQRAAWLITQIRATVGEQNFWRSLRKILADHALGSITGPEFVQAFAPALDQASIDKIIATLTRKPTPAVAIAATPGDSGTSLTLTLSDPSNAIVSAPTLAVIDASGNATPATLTPNLPLTITVPTGGYLASDEHDVHPDWNYSFSTDPSQFYPNVATLYVPSMSNAATLAAFETRSPAQQERGFEDYYYQPSLDGYAAMHAALTSYYAESTFEGIGCQALNTAQYTGGDVAGWTATLSPILQQPAYEALLYADGPCGVAFANQSFGAELAADTAAVTVANATRLQYIMSFDYGAAPSLQTIGLAATTAPSEQVRETALYRLVVQVTNSYYYSPLAPTDFPAYQDFFTARLLETTSNYHFESLWPAIMSLGDLAALPIVADKVHSIDFSAAEQQTVVCDAYGLTFYSPDPAGAWSAFQTAAQPWTTLGQAAQDTLANPQLCNGPAPSAIARFKTKASVSPIGALPNRPDAHVGERRIVTPPQKP